MTEKKEKSGSRFRSLYLELLVNILVGILCAALLYLGVQIIAGYYIDNVYSSPEKQRERREKLLEDLQNYATLSQISSEDTDLLAKWSRDNPYVYLMIYKDDKLFFSSDMKPEEPKEDADGIGEDSENNNGEGNNSSDGEDGAGSGESSSSGAGASGNQSPNTGGNNGGGNGGNNPWLGGSNEIDREQLMAEAQANGLHPINVKDGILFAALTEYTRDIYYSVANGVSLVVAAIALTIVLVNYMRRVIARIKRLENEVTMVSHFDMNHEIVASGEDEISKLSRDVEVMRGAMLENIRREREAREANTELVTSLSHDIRTPLTVLLGYIDMMKARAGDDEVMKSYLAASENTALRLKDLSNDMFKYALAFTDADANVKLEEYDAATLLEQLISEHIFLLIERGYDAKLSGDENAILPGETVVTDAQYLMRIIDNIFSNIYKYADKDSPVEIGVLREHGEIILYAENKIKKNIDAAESNGIGLKTCKRLAELVANGFKTQNDGETFTAQISLKTSNLSKM